MNDTPNSLASTEIKRLFDLAESVMKNEAKQIIEADGEEAAFAFISGSLYAGLRFMVELGGADAARDVALRFLEEACDAAELEASNAETL